MNSTKTQGGDLQEIAGKMLEIQKYVFLLSVLGCFKFTIDRNLLDLQY